MFYTYFMKTVVIGSKNPVKIESVKEAFALVWPEEEFEYISCEAQSGVPDQPFGSAQTKQGACNRALDSINHSGDGDYFVGLEGGLEEVDGEFWAMAWMCVSDKEGRCGFGKTSAFLLPPAVSVQIREGKELGVATDKVFNEINSKHKGGTVGILTNGIITRKDFYRDAIIFALIPFLHVNIYRG
jgi:inosine/xanthosine triphosphatase